MHVPIRLALILLPLGAAAQDPPPTFRATTRLVEVSVVALANGKPVTDLRKEDLAVTENGQTRQLAFFRYEGSPPAVTRHPRRTNVFTNAAAGTEETRASITAILFDAVNTDPNDQRRAYQQVTRYVQSMQAGARLALFHLGSRGVSVLHNFTDDIESLRARLEKAPTELPAQGIAGIRALAAQYEQLADYIGARRNMDMLQKSIAAEMRNNAQVRRNRLLVTQSALEAIGRHLSAIPGRKNLVWIGGGMSLVTIVGTGMGPDGETVSHAGDLHASAERLSQFGVSLYIVDPRGVTVPPGFLFDSQPGTGTFQRELDYENVNTDPRLAMALMASVTGGRVFNSNDMSDAVRQTVTDNGGSYALGFYTPDEPDGTWRRLRIRASRPGVRLLYRQGYVAEKIAPEPAVWGQERWRSLLSNPLGSALVRLTAHVEPGQAPGSLTINALIYTQNIHFRRTGDTRHAEIEVCLAELTRDGKAEFFTESTSLKLPPEQWKVLETSGIPYARTWKLAAATTTVRVIVRDRMTGQFGTLDIPLSEIRR